MANSINTDSLMGHAEALEGVEYSRIKEAQWIRAQLSNAIAAGEQETVNGEAVVAFLRRWTTLVSGELAH